MKKNTPEELPEGVSIAINSRDALGEGPWWSQQSQSLWRVDIDGQLLHCWCAKDDSHTKWQLPKKVGCFVPNLKETAGVVALPDGLHWLELRDNKLTQIAELEANLFENVFNDGKCDRNGNFWFGSKHINNTDACGNLYKITPDCQVTLMHTGVGVSNGIGWSPDNEICYYTDSVKRTIWAIKFVDDSIGSKDIFVRDEVGYPDGLTVDSEGFVWSAKWDGGRVVRYSPGGEIDFVLTLPISRPTSVMFGGEDLSRLYITSAQPGNKSESLAGKVFVLQTGTRGLGEKSFNPRLDHLTQ